MKRYILSLLAVSVIGLAYVSIAPDAKVHSNSTGAPGPGACTACHGGSVQTNGTVTIAVTENGNPVTEYQAGKTYDITVGMMDHNISRFGFALSSNIGTLAVVPGTSNVQKITNYLTHTFGGTTPAVHGTPAWTATWTAPATGTTAATFQLYINATNNSGTDQGDVIYGKSLTMPLSAVNGIADVINEKQFVIYPNPVNDQIGLKYELTDKANVKATLISINGQEIQVLLDKPAAVKGMYEETLYIGGDLAKGTYIVKLEAGNSVKYKKIFIQ